MKKWLTGFFMCQSMFCAIPCPVHTWDEDCRDKMLLCLPFLGLELGAVWYGLSWLACQLRFPPLMLGLVMGCSMFLLTGFLHLDGFMDTVDAVRSWRPLEQRREILKDSHVGSFSVIAVAMLITASVCAGASVKTVSGVMLLIPAATRACAVLAVLGLPPMHTSQYAAMDKKKSGIVFAAVVLILILAAGFALFGLKGLSPAAAAAGYGLGLRRGYRSLQGMNGDISGYALTLGELCGLCALVFL